MKNYNSKGRTTFKNTGNTCFMNSIIQIFAHTPIFREYFTLLDFRTDIYNKIKYEQLEELNNKNISDDIIEKIFEDIIADKISAQLAKLLLGALLSNETIKPLAFRKKIIELDESSGSLYNFKMPIHHDSHEFFGFLIDKIQNEIKDHKKIVHTYCHDSNFPKEFSYMDLSDDKQDNLIRILANKEKYRYFSNDNTIINRLFSGLFEIITTCKKCNYKSYKFEAFQTISLQIPNRKNNISLDDCFNEFFKEETIDDYCKCECCKFKTKVTRQFRINRFPKILIIQLKRFEFNKNFTGMKKISTPVSYPENDLNLDEYVSEYIHQKFTFDKPIYNLYAVNIHHGRINFGHYISFIKNNYNLKWNCYNDENYYQINNPNNDNAYLLFYFRKN